MTEAWWLALGIAAGVVAMMPLIRFMLRRAESRARLAERRARDAERLAELGSMTGGLAHEIKNPLSTVGLNAQLLSESIRDADLQPEQRDRLLRRIEALSREIDRLRGILDDFLQYAGRVKLDPQPCDLVQLINDLSDFFHPQCTQAGVVLRIQGLNGPGRSDDPAKTQITVNVDEKLLKQAILNLMLNAVQAMSETDYSESPGRAELILRLETEGDEARIHVTDTGPGLDPEHLKDIFRPYVSHRSGGTGLGLPTAQRIVQEHGGEITVHNEPGRGCDFVIHLPRDGRQERQKGVV